MGVIGPAHVPDARYDEVQRVHWPFRNLFTIASVVLQARGQNIHTKQKVTETRAGTHIHTRAHTRTHARIRIRTQTYAHTHARIHTRAHAHTYTHVHTHRIEQLRLC